MKSKKSFLILFAFLSVGLLAFSLIGIKVANAAVVFSDGFESGNLNQWTITYGSLTLSTQTVHSGQYSVQNSWVGQAENLYYHPLPSVPNPISFSEYVYINSTTIPSTSGNYYEVGGLSTSTGGNFGDGEICVFNHFGALYWGVFYRDSTSFWGFSHSISTSNSTSAARPVSIGWTHVELRQTKGTSGEEQLFVNDALVVDIFVNNNDRTPANAVIGGSQIVTNPNEKLNYYIDEVTVGDIPPPSTSLTMGANHGSVSPGSGNYPTGSIVTITATPPAAGPGERYIFQGWTGSGPGSFSGISNPAVIALNGPVTEVANWEYDAFLTVNNGGHGTASGSNWYASGTVASYSISPTTVLQGTDTRYVFQSWTDSSNATSNVTNSNGTITMNYPITLTANWKTQYLTTFNQSGLSSSSTGPVVTVAGSTKAYSDLPYTTWVDSGSSLSYSFTQIVPSNTTGLQYVSTGITGPASPLTITSPTTITGNWKTQYQITFNQSGLDSSATGSVLAVAGTAKSYTELPFSMWVDSGGTIAYSLTQTVPSSTSGVQFVSTGGTGPSSPINVTSPVAVTGNWKTQYQLSVSQNGLSSSATGSVLTVAGLTKAYADLPFSMWVDSNASVTYSYTQTVPSSVTGVQYVSTGGTGPASPLNMSAPTTITGNWKTQYLLTVNQIGLSSSSTGPVVTVAGSTKAYSDLPYTTWVDSGGSVAYSYTQTVSSSATGVQFVSTGGTGAASPLTVTSPTTITGNWKTQYQVTFNQTGIGSSAAGSVLTVAGSPKNLTELPFSMWVDSQGSVTYSFASLVPSSLPGVQFVATGSTGELTILIVTAPSTAIGNWKTQYQVSFNQSGLDSSANGPILTVAGSSKTFTNLPFSMWVDSGGSVAYAYTATVPSATPEKQFIFSTQTGPSSPANITSPTAFGVNYATQYYVKLVSEHGTTNIGGWVNATGSFDALVSSPADMIAQDHQWVCTGFSLDGGATQAGTHYVVSNVQGTHTISFSWKEQFWVSFQLAGLPQDLKVNSTINSINYAFPYAAWFDKDQSLNFTYGNHLANGYGSEYALKSTSKNAPVTVESATTITGTYISQYTTTMYLTIGIPIIVVVVVIAAVLMLRRRKTKGAATVAASAAAADEKS